MLTCLVPVLFTFYIQGVLKLKKNNSGAKGLKSKPDRNEWLASRPDRFTHEERAPDTYWVGPQTRSVRLRKDRNTLPWAQTEPVLKPAHRFYYNYFRKLCDHIVGRDSSVGIATRYGMKGPGIESRWGEIFHNRQDRPWGPPSLLYNGYQVFPGGKAAGAWRWLPTPI